MSSGDLSISGSKRNRIRPRYLAVISLVLVICGSIIPRPPTHTGVSFSYLAFGSFLLGLLVGILAIVIAFKARRDRLGQKDKFVSYVTIVGIVLGAVIVLSCLAFAIIYPLAVRSNENIRTMLTPPSKAEMGLPIYPNAKTEFGFRGGSDLSLYLTTDDPAGTVVTWYENALSSILGYEVHPGTTGESAVITIKQGSEIKSVNIGPNLAQESLPPGSGSTHIILGRSRHLR